MGQTHVAADVDDELDWIMSTSYRKRLNVMFQWRCVLFGILGQSKPGPELSTRTKQMVEILFLPADQPFVHEQLRSQCGFNVPGMRTAVERDIERIRFSVLKLSDGDLASLKAAVELAQVDVRDLWLNAGFKNPTDHEDWMPVKDGRFRQV